MRINSKKVVQSFRRRTKKALITISALLFGKDNIITPTVNALVTVNEYKPERNTKEEGEYGEALKKLEIISDGIEACVDLRELEEEYRKEAMMEAVAKNYATGSSPPPPER